MECGQQAIQKLASMFTDMALSDQLQEEYMRDSHHGSPGGVVHEVRVLQTNAWPEKADDAPVVPCQEKLGGQKKSPESVWIIVINIYKYIYIYIYNIYDLCMYVYCDVFLFFSSLLHVYSVQK